MESRFEADDHCPPAFKLLVSCPSGLSPSQLSVVFDQAYDRIPHPDTNLENSISEIWDRRVQQNSSLYNGLKFRYGGHNISGSADSSQEPDVCLHLGLTDYRTFVGTNLNPLWERFLFPSEGFRSFSTRSTESPVFKSSLTKSSNAASSRKNLDLKLSSQLNVLESPPVPSNHEVVELRVSIHCKGCEGKLRKHISKMEGVTSFIIDLPTKKVTVIGDITPLGVLTSISKVKNAQFWPSQSPQSPRVSLTSSVFR